MLSEEMLQEIYADEKVRNVPIRYATEMIHAIERVLERNGYDFQFSQRRNGTTDYPY